MAESTGPTLDQINLVVRDMDAMVEFYRRLGLEIGTFDESWDRHHRAVSTGAGLHFDLDSREFAAVWNTGWVPGTSGAVLGFRVPTRDQADRTFEELVTAGYGSQQPPYDAFWGARYAVVEDPDGNSVGLMSPVDPDRKSSPPPPA